MKKIKLTEAELTKIIKKVINEQRFENVKRMTPDEFMGDLKQTLWGRGPSRESELGNTKSGNMQNYIIGMNNENEIMVYYGDYDPQGTPEYIIKL